MNKNCMLCANRELAINMMSNREYSRCALDREMHVNERMGCEEWTDVMRDAVDAFGALVSPIEKALNSYDTRG